MRARAALLLILALALGSARAADALQPFGPGSAATLAAAHRGQAWALVLWSVDCGPCLKEFQAMADLRRAGIGLPLVLVATDGLARQAEVSAVLARFGLADLENWVFADEDAQRLRYEIDPTWYGEMPRSYFHGPDGSRRGHSGGLTADELRAWAAALPAGPP